MLPDGWTKVTLGDIGEFKNGINKAKEDFGHGFPLVGLNDIFGKSRISKKRFELVNSNEKEKEAYSLKKGDLLFVRSSVKPIGVGQTCLIDEDIEDATYSGFIIRYRPDASFKHEYLAHCFYEPNFRNRLLAVSTISANTNINQESLKKLWVFLPPLSEQSEIAETLNTWDTSIANLIKLITIKQKQKKALMQRLLTGKHRFPEFEGQEWKKLKLSEFLIPTLREEDKPKENYLAIGIRSHCKGTFQKPDSDPAKIAMEKLYTVKKDDLIVNITFAWEGAIALVKEEDEGGYVSHRFPTYVFDTEKAIPEFFRYIIASKRFRHILDLISPGGAGRNRVLSKKEFVKIEWPMPSVPEQQKIAAVLNAADKGINLLTQKLEAYQKQKKGLMQQLLTGKKRVKIDRQEAA